MLTMPLDQTTSVSMPQGATNAVRAQRTLLSLRPERFTYKRLRFVSHLTDTPNSSLSLARDALTGTLFVVKSVTLTAHSSSERAELDFFTRQLQRKRTCENLVTCFGLETVNSQALIITLEFCSHGDFHYLLYEDRSRKFYELEFLQRLSFVFQAANAILFCHRELLSYHGDIKGSNFLLADDFTLKLCDFGSSVLFDTNEKQSVVTSSGTIPYCAPEVLFRKAHGFESDWWSFGVFATEVLCFQNIFELGKLKDSDELKLNAICYSDMDLLISSVRFENSVSQDFVRRLLERDQLCRLQDESVIFHPIFNILLNDLAHENIKPGL